MWEIYDMLISGIPEDIKVVDVIVGLRWTMARTDTNAGLAMTVNETTAPTNFKHVIVDAPLKEAAALVKSWNFVEAGIGLAAINAYYNSKEAIIKNASGLSVQTEWDASDENCFESYKGIIKCKKVAVIGHFKNIETYLSSCNEVCILERKPGPGDYPDTACEYLLPGRDYVFITGSAFINKTMPRLLEISKGSKIILAGPSVPLAPLLFQYGACDLSGFVVVNQTYCRRAICEGNIMPLFESGKRVRLYKRLEERK